MSSTGNSKEDWKKDNANTSAKKRESFWNNFHWDLGFEPIVLVSEEVLSLDIREIRLPMLEKTLPSNSVSFYSTEKKGSLVWCFYHRQNLLSQGQNKEVCGDKRVFPKVISLGKVQYFSLLLANIIFFFFIQSQRQKKPQNTGGGLVANEGYLLDVVIQYVAS